MQMGDFRRSRGLGLLLAVRFLKQRRPFAVTLMVNSSCNTRCSYCSSPLLKMKEMETRTILQMVDEFVSLGMRHLAITGGEPLLREDIGTIVDYAHSLGVRTRLTTNGSLVKNALSKLKNLDALIVSLDGRRSFNDKIRYEGSYAHALSAVKRARKAGIVTWITAVLTRQEKEDINHLLAIAEKYGASLIVQPAFTSFQSPPPAQLQKIVSHPEQLCLLIEYILSLKKEGLPIMNSLTYLKKILKSRGGPVKMDCWASRLFCEVSPSGEVCPCLQQLQLGSRLSGVKMGFAEAFSQLRDVSCEGCSCVSFVEMNTAFSRFSPEVLINSLRCH